MNGYVLSPGREARRRLAFDDVWATRDGDPNVHREKIQALLDVNERVWAEQYAELGYLPSTVEGCIGVLHTAAAILELIGRGDA